jgi:hypothetical protein
MPSLPLLQKKGRIPSNRLSDERISTNIADTLFVDRTNAVPVTAGNTLGDITLRRFRLYGFSASATVNASFRSLSAALGANDRNKRFTTMRTFHLFFLHRKTLYKTIDIPLVSPQLVKEFLGSFIREKTI